MKSSTKTWIIVGVVLLLLMIGFAVYAGMQKTTPIVSQTPTPIPPANSGSSPFDWISGIIGKIFKNKNTNNQTQSGCDTNKPGYDINGLPSLDCGFGAY